MAEKRGGIFVKSLLTKLGDEKVSSVRTLGGGHTPTRWLLRDGENEKTNNGDHKAKE